MTKALNQQVNMEAYSYYLYLSLAAYFDHINFPGIAKWQRLQANEEQEHMMKIFNYITERGGRVILTDIAAPKNDWTSPIKAFENALAQEKKVTKAIHQLYDKAHQENDHASAIFLQWFITEQVEEESSISLIIERLRHVKTQAGLLLIERELNER